MSEKSNLNEFIQRLNHADVLSKHEDKIEINIINVRSGTHGTYSVYLENSLRDILTYCKDELGLNGKYIKICNKETIHFDSTFKELNMISGSTIYLEDFS